MSKRDHIIPFGVATGRDHLDDAEACWCEVVTFYVSDATGRRATLHRTFPQRIPPPETLALARMILDAEDFDEPADHG